MTVTKSALGCYLVFVSGIVTGGWYLCASWLPLLGRVCAGGGGNLLGVCLRAFLWKLLTGFMNVHGGYKIVRWDICAMRSAHSPVGRAGSFA